MRVLNQWQFSPSLNEARRLRQALSELFDSLDSKDQIDSREDFLLACSELIVNLCRYPEPKPDSATLRFCQDEFYNQLELLDNGASFLNFSQQLARTEPLEAAESGMGLKLLASRFDSLSYIPACYREDAQNLMLVRQQRRQPLATLLVVDDDPVYRSVINAYLAPSYRVLIAEDVSSGYALLLQHQPELVICDISMPGGNGPQLFDRMFKVPEVATTAFIYLSGCQDQAVIERALGRPVDDFLAKPVERDKLLISVQRTLLRRRHLLQQLQTDLEQKVTLGLQPNLPRQIGGYQLAVRSQVPQAGGGDMLVQRDQLLMFADLMGHGVTAKGFAYALAGYFRGLCAAASQQLSPQQLMERVSEGFAGDEVLSETLATLLCLQLQAKGSVVICNAGQPRPVVCFNGKLTEVEVDGPLLGFDLQPETTESPRYPMQQIQLPIGARLVIFSDGYLDAAQSMPVKLAELIVASAQQSLAQAADSLMQYRLQQQLDDDMTLIVIQRDS